MDILLILTTIFLLTMSLRKAGLLPYPTGIIAILLLSQLCFILAHNDIVTYSMLKVYSFGGQATNYTLTQVIYTLSALFILLTLTGKYKRLRSTATFYEAIKKAMQSSLIKRGTPFLIFVIFLHASLFLTVVDWDDLWLYHVYLGARADTDIIDTIGVTLSDTITRITPLFALISSAVTCLCAKMRRPLSFILSLSFTLFYFALLIGQHSRTAAFIPGLAAVFIILTNDRRRLLFPFFLIFLTGLSVFSALAGRSSNEHGLSTVPYSLVRPFIESNEVDLAQVALDFTQGIFVTAESLQIDAPFNMRYKILSFSPLPSIIDGYSAIRGASEHRIHLYVPMGGVGEAINFGLIFLLSLLLLVTIIARTHTHLKESNPIAFILCNFLIMFSCYLLFSYPLRNALRYAWLAFYISLIPLALRAITSKPKALNHE